MSTRVQSYLCTLLVGLGLLVVCGAGHAQQLYLDPDSVFITTGAGTEFDLDLRVDANTQGIRLFQVLFAFDTSKLDTVSTALGPLFSGTPYTKIFNAYIYYDNEFQTTVLRLEGLLFGATAVVNGPGVVADVRLVTKSAGTVDLTVLRHVMTDINNDPINSTASGAVVFINAPPSSFNLIDPSLGEEVTIFADSSLHLIWQRSRSVYSGETVKYRCELSTTATFNGGTTTTFSNLTDTVLHVPGNTLTLNHAYWYRVTAIGGTYGFERQSDPFGQTFYVREPDKPAAFTLREPGVGDSVYVIPAGSVMFIWGSSTSPYPAVEAVRYEFSCSPDPSFSPSGTVVAGNLTDTSYAIPESFLLQGVVYWRVRAYGSVFGTERWATPNPSSFYFAVGAPPGEFHLVSPVNAGLTDVYGRTVITFDWSDAASLLPGDTTTYTLTVADDPGFGLSSVVFSGTVKDVSTLAVASALLPVPEYVYWKVSARNRFGFERDCTASFSTRCFMRGDLTSAYRAINVADLTFLVSFLFRGGPPPVVGAASDLNCNGDTNVADLTSMVSFLFRGGSGPYCP